MTHDKILAREIRPRILNHQWTTRYAGYSARILCDRDGNAGLAAFCKMQIEEAEQMQKATEYWRRVSELSEVRTVAELLDLMLLFKEGIRELIRLAETAESEAEEIHQHLADLGGVRPQHRLFGEIGVRGRAIHRRRVRLAKLGWVVRQLRTELAQHFDSF